jgi:tRNA1(Val) A37 N6-methylase TrmN6
MRNPLQAPTIRQALCSTDHPPEQELEFYNFLRLPNGTFKTTRPGRLVDVDELLLEQLSPAPQPLKILDVGVSSGTLSAELAKRLSERGIEAEVYASDLYLEADSTRCWPLHLLTLPDGHILQVDVGSLSFPNTPPSRLTQLVYRVVTCLQPVLRRGTNKKVKLISQVARNSSVRFSAGDVFGELCEQHPNQRYDVIRVANLLNPAYFTTEKILQAASNLKRHLRQQGLLLVARSAEQGNLCTLFRKQENRFVFVSQLHGGVEIAPLLLQMHSKPPRESTNHPDVAAAGPGTPC